MDKEFLKNLQVDGVPLPEPVVEQIWLAHEKAMHKAAGDWQAQHQQAVRALKFDHAMHQAITAAGGRSVGAILGELGAKRLEQIRESDDQAAQIQAALETLRRDSGYLFGRPEGTVPYAPGPGTGGGTEDGFHFGFHGIRRVE